MSSGLLDGLGGIDEPRDVRAREQTTLDKLLETGETIIRKYAGAFPDDSCFTYLSDISYTDLYTQLYIDLKESFLKDVNFKDEDIKHYVTAMADRDFGTKDSQALGAYTGALLQLFTERNRLQGKSTVFYINGNGSRFSYLFYLAKDVDRLIVEDFTGNNICRSIGIGYESFANQIIGINITGNNVFRNIGNSQGCVEQVIGVSIKGEMPLSHIGSDFGRINHVVGIDLEGFDALFSVGRIKGQINQVLGYGLKGDNALNSTGEINAQVDKIIGLYIEGDQALGNVGGGGSQVNQVFGVHIKGKQVFNGLGQSIPPTKERPDPRYKGTVKQLVYHDAHKLSTYMHCGQVICGTRAESMYEQMLKENHVEEMVALARSMQGKPYQEILRIADELYAMRPQAPEVSAEISQRIQKKMNGK